MSEATLTQDNRFLAIGTPLGKDKLLLVAMHGTEALGRLFQYEMDLISEGSPVAANDILGKNITVSMETISGTTRYFNGFIAKFSFVGFDVNDNDQKKIFSYRATLVPRLWFLTRTSDCRIFQDMTVKDIIEAVFKDRGFSDYKFDLTGDYRTWEYCVQYRETDFNFVSRLMENEGMYYYFDHEDGKHTMTICDAPSAHKTVDSCESLHFDMPDPKSTDDAFIWNWTVGQEITPSKHSLTDYDPLQPRAQQQNADNVTHDHDPEPYEIFDYPGGFVAPEDGKTYANIRMEEAEARYIVGRGTSSARGIHAGAIFKLMDHPASEEADYLVTAVSYQMHNAGMAQGQGGGGPVYLCQVTCIPKTYEFRAPRTTPKPVVQGPQTAVVTGPSGEEIYTDKYGRVKVQFFWDREGKKNETSSCWIRVSQNWAGKQWGIVFNPRIGQEVIVDFLEGDPDRPIITGRVYNADQMPPYTLPANQTQSAIKTRSSKEGTQDNFNEIRIEDKKGSEDDYVHAEKDMNRVVENNDSLKVGSPKQDKGDQTIEIFNNQVITVGLDQCADGSRTEGIWNSEKTTIGAGKGQAADGSQIVGIWNNQQITIGSGKGQNSDGSQTIEIWKDRTVTIDTGNDSLEIKQGNRTVAIDTGDDSLDVKQGNRTVTIDTGNESVTLKTGNRDVKISMGNDSLALSMGNQSVKCDLGSISSEAMQSIELKVGGNSIKVDQMGVTITGMMIKIEGQVQTEVKGLMCQVSGDAMLQAKGAITMIG